MQTITLRMDKQWDPTTWHSELYPVSWDRPWWKIIWGSLYIYIHTYIYTHTHLLCHFAILQKLVQHCKSTIILNKVKNKLYHLTSFDIYIYISKLVKWYNLFFTLFKIIVDLQCCTNFCSIAKWQSRCVCVYIYVCIYIYKLPHIIFHHGLSQETGYSSLCHVVGSHCLSILNVIVCIY